MRDLLSLIFILLSSIADAAELGVTGGLGANPPSPAPISTSFDDTPVGGAPKSDLLGVPAVGGRRPPGFVNDLIQERFSGDTLGASSSVAAGIADLKIGGGLGSISPRDSWGLGVGVVARPRGSRPRSSSFSPTYGAVKEDLTAPLPPSAKPLPDVTTSSPPPTVSPDGPYSSSQPGAPTSYSPEDTFYPYFGGVGGYGYRPWGLGGFGPSGLGPFGGGRGYGGPGGGFGSRLGYGGGLSRRPGGVGYRGSPTRSRLGGGYGYPSYKSQPGDPKTVYGTEVDDDGREYQTATTTSESNSNFNSANLPGVVNRRNSYGPPLAKGLAARPSSLPPRASSGYPSSALFPDGRATGLGPGSVDSAKNTWGTGVAPPPLSRVGSKVGVPPAGEDVAAGGGSDVSPSPAGGK